MLRPAQLYKEELLKKEMESWYDPRALYYWAGTGCGLSELPEDTYYWHNFVSVNDSDSIVGYIAYKIDWAAMSASDFCIYSFEKNGSILFAEDLCKAICDLFEVYHVNRIDWWCYTDNPAIRGYRNFIALCGGREVGIFRQICKLQDGKLHDSASFEILANEFRCPKRYHLSVGS